MSFKVKTKLDRFKFADGEAALLYRKPSDTKMLMFTLSYSKNGRVDLQGSEKADFVFDAMDMFVKDWEGVTDEDTGKIVEYDKDLLELVPEDDINNFINEIVNPELDKCLSDAKDKIEESKTKN